MKVMSNFVQCCFNKKDNQIDRQLNLNKLKAQSVYFNKQKQFPEISYNSFRTLCMNTTLKGKTDVSKFMETQKFL